MKVYPLFLFALLRSLFPQDLSVLVIISDYFTIQFSTLQLRFTSRIIFSIYEAPPVADMVLYLIIDFH